MNSSYVEYFLSILLGGTIVWLFLRATFAKTKVPRTEFEELNSNFRDSMVENVKLEERISIIQERVEELSEKLLKAEQELSIASDAKNSLSSINPNLQEKMNTQKTDIENISQKMEKDFD
jgi:hypothetical protein